MKRFLLLIPLLAFSLYAAPLPSTPQQELLTDFSGGLDTQHPSHKLATGFSPYMRGTFIDNNKLERPGGFLAIGSSNTLQKVTGIFPFVRESGQTTFLVTDSSITLETPDFKSWVFVSSGSNTGTLLRWKQIRNKMWGFNGIDFVITWDGTTKVRLDGSGTGAAQTPNVPKFKYCEYYQDRVWGLNVPNAGSDLYFTSVVTTETTPTIIAPDHFLAWPPTNVSHINQGNGQIGVGLWIADGLLRVGKERSIYTEFGTDPTSYKPREEETQVGLASQDSVVIADGLTHFVGQEGVYKNITRISDLIEPDFLTFARDTQKNLQNSWETQPDFLRGNLQYGTTATPAGLVTLPRLNDVQAAPYQINYTTHSGDLTNLGPGTSYFFAASGGDTGFVSVVVTNTFPSNWLGYVFTVKSIANCSNSCGNYTFSVKNSRTGLTRSVVNSGLFGTGYSGAGANVYDNETVFTGKDNILFTGDDINLGRVQCRVQVDASGDGTSFYSVYPATTPGYSNWTMMAASTGSFTSEITTLAAVTSWGTFDSLRNTNAGQISFYLRSSTSLVNIATKTWASIQPGSIINEPIINNFVQWSSTIIAISSNSLPSIDNVTIDHIEGSGSLGRPFAIEWKNRYWLNVSTTSDQTRRIIYVKSKITNKNPDAWMPIQDIPVCSFARNVDTFYGGDCSTGVIYRLDYGTNNNGLPISSYYDTPDMTLGNIFYDKMFQRYLVEGSKSVGGTMNIGSSVNQGTVSISSFSIDGTGRYSKEVNGVVNKGKTLRLELFNSELDKTFQVNSIGIIYMPTEVISDK